jgi:hypothetical protein
MASLFRQAVTIMEASFRRLEDQVPKPVVVQFQDGEALRYAERTIHQAIVQKLARYVSGLNAVDLLFHAGQLQEQAVIQRSLDEIGEDLQFLALGISRGETGLHRKFLKVFWQEEFEDGVAPLDNTKGRYQIRRSDIRGFMERLVGAAADSPEAKAGAVLSQTYSGYVHAASPHIMEMCGGPELRFFVSGLANTSRMASSAGDAWNYAFRGLLVTTAVARAFGDEVLSDRLSAVLSKFEEASGTSYQADVRGRVPAAPTT